MIKEIKTEKFEGLAVLVPGNSFNYVVRQNAYQADLWYDGHFGDNQLSACIDLPFAKYEIIGKSTDLTEEQCADIIDFTTEQDIDEPEVSTTSKIIEIRHFKDYIQDEDFPVNFYDIDTAKESFSSLMQSLECYAINPMGKELDIEDYLSGSQYAHFKRKWDALQANTGTWLILQKL